MKYKKKVNLQGTDSDIEGATENFIHGLSRTRQRIVTGGPEILWKSRNILPSYFPFAQKPYLENEREILEKYLQEYFDLNFEGKPEHIQVAASPVGYVFNDIPLEQYVQKVSGESDSAERVAARLLKFIDYVNHETSLSSALDLAYKIGRNWEIFDEYRQASQVGKKNSKNPRRNELLNMAYEETVERITRDQKNGCNNPNTEYWSFFVEQLDAELSDEGKAVYIIDGVKGEERKTVSLSTYKTEIGKRLKKK